MKNYRKELWFEVPTRRALVNITPKVEACLPSTSLEADLLSAYAENHRLCPWMNAKTVLELYML